MKIACLLAGLLLSAPALGQITAVESLEPVAATAPVLGQNINTDNEFEWQLMQSLGATVARSDCHSWGGTETQVLPGNTSGGYTSAGCGNAFTFAKKYAIKPWLNALYGPPYQAALTGTLSAPVAVGDTVVHFTQTSAGPAINDIVDKQTCIYLPNGPGFFSSRHGYCGVTVTAHTATSVTMAAASQIALPAGTQIQLNVQLYPPVLIGPGENFYNNPSVVAFVNYAHAIAQDCHANGVPCVVAIWNEPEWPDEKWDAGESLYDTPPANGRIEPGGLAMELPYAVAKHEGDNPVAGVTFDNGYTQISGWVGAFGWLDQTQEKVYSPIMSQVAKAFSTQSLHPYGNTPEDMGFVPSCLRSFANDPATYQPGWSATSVFNACPITGVGNRNAGIFVPMTAMFPYAQGGPGTMVSESGLCMTCFSATPSETARTRWDLRQFLYLEGLRINPFIFYRLYDASDSSFRWCAGTTESTCAPVFASFKRFMSRLHALSSPAAPYAQCMAPKVTSYSSPSWPLAQINFAGALPGYRANSWLMSFYQRTYSNTAVSPVPAWVTVASPAAVSTTIAIPAGLSVSYVEDSVTLQAVAYTASAGSITFPVADNPVTIQLDPVSSTTSPLATCN